MRRLRVFFLSLTMVFSVVTFAAAPAFAADPFQNIDCTKAPTSAVCKDRNQTTNPLTGKDGLLRRAANILALLGAVIAVIMIVVAGFQFVASGGDSKKVSDAKNVIIYSIIGLVVIAFARTLVIFVLNRI